MSAVGRGCVKTQKRPLTSTITNDSSHANCAIANVRAQKCTASIGPRTFSHSLGRSQPIASVSVGPTADAGLRFSFRAKAAVPRTRSGTRRRGIHIVVWPGTGAMRTIPLTIGGLLTCDDFFPIPGASGASCAYSEKRAGTIRRRVHLLAIPNSGPKTVTRLLCSSHIVPGRTGIVPG
jgi:hypothetical protein